MSFSKAGTWRGPRCLERVRLFVSRRNCECASTLDSSGGRGRRGKVWGLSTIVVVVDSDSLTPSVQRRDAVAYIVLAALVCTYVAVCTGQWDNIPGTDAWEHHRAIVALTHDLSNPANPTFASDEPSIRYSPYSVGLALLSRATGWDPYLVLGGAAVFNTALLFIGLWTLMHRWSATPVGPALIIVVTTLYGGAPGYAGSFALTDLPWHQLNPSAFAVALSLFSFAILDRMLVKSWSWSAALLIALLTATALLSHGMTALFTGFGLLAVAWVRSSDPIRATLWVVGISIGAAALGLLWPYYDLKLALLERPENDTWFNPGILYRMLFQWSLPALLAAGCALSYRNRPFAQIGLIGGGLCYLAGLTALVGSSPSLARMPLAGVLLLNFAVATFVHESRLLDPRSWTERARALVGADQARSRSAWAESIVAIGILFFGVPQLLDVAREPHLARAYVAPLLGKQDKQLDLKPRYDRFLEGVGARDVVLADALTAWPVPSSAGRVVSAFHWEFFSPDQSERRANVDAFFSLDLGHDRVAILDKYRVSWIFLNRDELGQEVFEFLLEPAAVVRRDEGWTLMDAARWRRVRQTG